MKTRRSNDTSTSAMRFFMAQEERRLKANKLRADSRYDNERLTISVARSIAAKRRNRKLYRWHLVVLAANLATGAALVITEDKDWRARYVVA